MDFFTEKKDEDNLKKERAALDIKSVITLWSLKNYKEALECLTKQISSNPNEYSNYIKKATILRYYEEYEDEVICYDAALRNFPNNCEIYYLRGCALLELNIYEEAIDNFNEAIRINNKHKESFFQKGRSLWQLEFFEEAIESLQSAINIDSGYIDAYLEKALVLSLSENFNEAIETCDLVIKIDNTNLPALYKKVQYLLSLKEFQKALEITEEIIKIDVNSIQPFYERGNIYFLMIEYERDKQNFLEKAILDFDQVIENDTSILKKNSLYKKFFIEFKYGNKEMSINFFRDAENVKCNKIESHELRNEAIELIKKSELEIDIDSSENEDELSCFNTEECEFEKEELLVNPFDITYLKIENNEQENNSNFRCVNGLYQNTPVEIKYFKLLNIEKEYIYDLLSTQICEMKKLNNKNIPFYFGNFMKNNEIAIVIEKLTGRSLYEAIHQDKINFSFYEKIKILIDVANAIVGLNYLNVPLYQRKMNSSNIIIIEGKKLETKLKDFITYELQNEMLYSKNNINSDNLNLNKEFKSDVYNFGILIWEIMVEEQPDINKCNFKKVDIIDIPQKIKYLLNLCINQREDNRCNFIYILKYLEDILIS